MMSNNKKGAGHFSSSIAFQFMIHSSQKSFKSKNTKFDLISLSSKPFDFSFLPLLGLCIGHHGLYSTQFTKKIMRRDQDATR